MRELSAKARRGTLTPEEDAEMDNFERVGSILSILKSKARQVLKRSRRVLDLPWTPRLSSLSGSGSRKARLEPVFHAQAWHFLKVAKIAR
jgi:hypothetical protein